MATVPGIDVSYWNSGIDWPKVRATGQRFVFVKATEAASYRDPTFDDIWLGGKSAGLLRGAYLFFRWKKWVAKSVLPASACGRFRLKRSSGCAVSWKCRG